MAVYVDEIADWSVVAAARGLRHTHWCHLLADTREELHAFADRLGLRRAWFQDDPVRWHYDITPGMRRRAVALGAEQIDHARVAQLMNERR